MSTPQEVVMEAFYRMAAAEAQENHAIATLSPWPRGSEAPPPKVLVLDRMDEEQITTALNGSSLVMAGSTFSTDEEIEYANKYLPILARGSAADKYSCVILFQLATPDMCRCGTDLDRHFQRLNSITNLGMDEMVFLPDLKPHLFHQKLKSATMIWQSNVERIAEMLLHEAPRPSEKEIEKLEQHHNMLLWTDIPSALMPKFKKLDPSLVQNSNGIGKYTWIQDPSDRSYASASDEHGFQVTIKIVDKVDVFTADDLEGMFREYRFLSELLSHPNLPRCVDLLHGPEKVYFLFEGPAMQTAYLMLQQKEQKRASSAVSLEVFAKLVSAVAYIHSQCCVHRNISVKSVHVQVADNDAVLGVKLFDFEKAVQARGGQSAVAICGNFPSMAPEMVSGEPYVPHLADCWSVGSVLLELAGGLGSLEAALETDFQGLSKSTMILLESFLLKPNCHQIALTSRGAPPNDDVIKYLQRTLLTPADHRYEMANIFKD